MSRLIPNIDWYISVSEIKHLQPRCPFATVQDCPRFYQSLSLLGEAGSTAIEPEEDEHLLGYWKRSDLWPRTDEYATSIEGPSGSPRIFSKFCPEVAYDRFGYFASYLSRYADGIDTDLAHKRLGEEGVQRSDWRWQWRFVEHMHYTDCPLYSVLDRRFKENHFPFGRNSLQVNKLWYEKPIGMVLIGIIVAVIGGLILQFIF